VSDWETDARARGLAVIRGVTGDELAAELRADETLWKTTILDTYEQAMRRGKIREATALLRLWEDHNQAWARELRDLGVFNGLKVGSPEPESPAKLFRELLSNPLRFADDHRTAEEVMRTFEKAETE
jgi:hypothetical protein